MAFQFRFWPIDHAEGTFEPWPQQTLSQVRGTGIAQGEQESRDAGVVAQSLITSGQRRADRFDLHRTVPVRGGGDEPAMGPKADRGRCVAEFLAAKGAGVL